MCFCGAGWQLCELVLDEQGRGLLQHPVELCIQGSCGDKEGAEGPQVQCDKGSACDAALYDSSLRADGLQEFSACLGLLGPLLDDLTLIDCGHPIFTSQSLRALWACPNLRCLIIDECDLDIDAEDMEAGLQHLRYTDVSPLGCEAPHLCKACFPDCICPPVNPDQVLLLCGAKQAARGLVSIWG